MTDRELLELAAKAAGYTVRCVGDGRYGGNVVFYMEPSQLYWNPLTNDGDALRLAVACSLTVCTDGDATVSACEAFRLKTGAFVTQSVSECADKFAATRRAIVRAAAAIGEASK